ncbi:MAG: calcium/sodium antiporter [Pseudomonadota bacterium]
MDYVLVVVGLLLLVFAGDAMVRGAVAAALKFDMSPLLIGATIVAVGTSAPELFVGVDAVLKGAPTLALGNVVGSNIANILLALGLPAIILPISTAATGMARTTMVMLAATAVVLIAGMTDVYRWPTGIIFLVLLGLFVSDSIRSSRKSALQTDTAPGVLDDEIDLEDAQKLGGLATAAFLLGGLVGVIVGADFLVRGAVSIAMKFGVSEAVIGLTLVAIGTSLPELATALIAAFKGHGDVAIGNIIGSNIFNLFGIIGASALVGDIPVPADFWAFDFWVMVAASLVLLPFCVAKIPIGRIAGFIMFSCYCAYIWATAQAALDQKPLPTGIAVNQAKAATL